MGAIWARAPGMSTAGEAPGAVELIEFAHAANMEERNAGFGQFGAVAGDVARLADPHPADHVELDAVLVAGEGTDPVALEQRPAKVAKHVGPAIVGKQYDARRTLPPPRHQPRVVAIHRPA